MINSYLSAAVLMDGGTYLLYFSKNTANNKSDTAETKSPISY